MIHELDYWKHRELYIQKMDLKSPKVPLLLQNEDNISDSEDNLRQREVSQRPRPSFTIGSSDSESVSTSVESHHRLPPNNSEVKSQLLKPIQTGFGGSSKKRSRSPSPAPGKSTNTSSGLEYAGKPGYMGGSRSLTSSVSTEVNLNLGDDNSEEIKLYATEDSSFGWNKRQWVIFAMFGFVEFFSAMVISLQAPFYPAESELKGATATEYGIVFGIFELTVFIISPIYGSKINKIGPKLVFNLGITTTAISAILFGFLDKIDDRTLFVSLSIITRIVEALGEAAFITSSFVIIATEFPQHVATTFATMETFYGLGLIAGPLVGGILYQTGGYILPFITIGSLLLFAAFITSFVLPKTRKMKSDPGAVTPGFQMFKLLRVPAVALAAFSIFSASSSVGYLNATLEPHIRQFNLTPITTGAIFIVNGGFYALSAPIWGYICDSRVTQLKYITLLGSSLIIIGFSMIGPIPYIPFETTIWAVIVGQIIQGIGLGAVLVSAFIQALRDALNAGFSDDIGTYGLVSGVWTSMFALGSFFGPVLAGLLYDNVGFRIGTLFIIGLQIIVVFLVTIFICKNSVSNSAEEMESLIPSKPTESSKRSRKQTNKKTLETYGSI